VKRPTKKASRSQGSKSGAATRSSTSRPRTSRASDGAWLPKLIGDVVDKHMAHKEAAILFGLDKGQLTRQFQGDGHLSAKRVGLLPREVLLAIADGIKAHYGVADPDAERRQAVEDAMRAIGKLTMLAVREVR